MSNDAGMRLTEATVPAMVFDPTQPIQRMPVQIGNRSYAPGQNQRQRRAAILATIRRLLIDDGFEGVTVRRIAECSGHAVQTIYNLVGSRSEEHTSELQSLIRNSYAVLCLKKKKQPNNLKITYKSRKKKQQKPTATNI